MRERYSSATVPEMFEEAEVLEILSVLILVVDECRIAPSPAYGTPPRNRRGAGR
jgi:hypothetical protein